MKQSERWNTLQICPRWDLNSGGSDLWSNTLPVRPRRLPIGWIISQLAELSYIIPSINYNNLSAPSDAGRDTNRYTEKNGDAEKYIITQKWHGSIYDRKPRFLNLKVIDQWLTSISASVYHLSVCARRRHLRPSLSPVSG